MPRAKKATKRKKTKKKGEVVIEGIQSFFD